MLPAPAADSAALASPALREVDPGYCPAQQKGAGGRERSGAANTNTG
jgi:hypothetical protein